MVFAGTLQSKIPGDTVTSKMLSALLKCIISGRGGGMLLFLWNAPYLILRCAQDGQKTPA